ncbi:MAG: hypothetical protein U1F10_15530 [Burkholderiales bacterium]
MAETFEAYRRSAFFDLASGATVGGRLQATLPVTLADVDNPARTSPPGGAPFELLGPGDVRGLMPAAITKRVPAPGTGDAVETKAAHVEFAALDLPWRYTPELAGDDGALRPWLVLVTGVAGDEVVLRADGTVQLAKAVLAAHDLAKSYQWAHVHDVAGGAVARLLSPRDCLADTSYIAALVPAFTVTGDGEDAVLADAWGAGAQGVTLPCYDAWSFRTGPEGDFAQIAARLAPVSAAEIGPTFGVANVRCDWRDPAHAGRAPLAVPMGAALERTDGSANALPLDADLAQETLALTVGARTFQGRWVLTAPQYEAPWTAAAALATPTGWRLELRNDVRRRGAAGLGAWAGIEWQQKIADAAAAQAGAVAAAAQRIRYLTLGLAATRSLWRRRLPPDPVARLALFAPLLGRLPVASGGTVLDHVDGRTPAFARALFSSALRRIARNGTARAALAAPGAVSVSALLIAANRCPPPQPRDSLLERIVKGDGRAEDRARAWREVLADAERRAGGADDWRALLPSWLLEGRAFPAPAVFLALLRALDPGGGRPPDVGALRAIAPSLAPSDAPGDAALDGLISQLVGRTVRERPEPPCAPLDLAGLAARVSAAVDPTVERPIAVERVLGTIGGLREPLLAPPDVAPELDLPLWKFVADWVPDWLLPGVGMLPTDRVVAVQTNPVFVEAFLVGANHQTLAELRWRNVPIMAGWSPLRRFWQRPVLPPAPTVDITPVSTWPAATALGDVAHRADPAAGTQLVVVLRTELFRRYPATAVYLVSALGAGGTVDWSKVPAPGDPGWVPIDPVLSGTIGSDVVFFGFPVPASAAADHWLVLEEPPPGYRFYTEAPPVSNCEARTFDAAAAAKNGAEFAAARFATPVRVFLGALLGQA